MLFFAIPKQVGISYKVGIYLSKAKTIAHKLALEFEFFRNTDLTDSTDFHGFLKFLKFLQSVLQKKCSCFVILMQEESPMK
jgi:hypothetical protein